MLRVRPRLDPLLDVGQLDDPLHKRHELGRLLLPIIGDPVAQHLHGVGHADEDSAQKLFCS